MECYVGNVIHKAQSTKYVREAQLFLGDGGYLDAWAVFDKDQRPDHAHAFRLAENAGVKIAFSSLAFEIWILSHFEKSLLDFDKVQYHPFKARFSCSINWVN